MSILAFGGEMGFFVPSDSNVIEATSSLSTVPAYNSAFARCYTGSSGATAYALTPTVSGQTDFWFHFDVTQSGISSTSTLSTLIELLDGSGVARLRLVTDWESSGSTAVWQMEYLNGAVWTSLGSFTANPDTLQTVDIHVVCNTASGSANLYLSGTQRIGSGTVNLSSITSITQGKLWGKKAGLNCIAAYSQVIMASESTIGMKVGTIVMTGQGSTHTFTSGGFANIDETAYSDADEIHSDTATQVELFTGTPVPSFTGYTIRALGIYARAKKSGTGPAQMQLALRSAGTTYFSATQALDFGYGAIGNAWATNPATSAAFLSSEIAALEYGVKSIT